MCFLYGASTTVLMNGILDNSKPEIYKVRVIEKKSCAGKNRSSYLTLSPWSELKNPKEVDVGKYTYDFHEVGDSVDVAVYKGKLGITWFKIL
ncbi:hypothetical protein [Desulforegula conservatrix]|uniref:hypothetical protein n=1 Tax=Desulforegula conservatrix TaxID=153026 RepID=UPI0004880173|nr:hypothetical protein [Desulforegula conservatrix]